MNITSTHPEPALSGGSSHARSTRWALASLSLCVLLSSLGTSIANVALPSISQAFGASFEQVQWIVLAYLLAVTALIVGAGRLGDLVGRRQLLTAGLALFTIASLACGAAPTLGMLVAARVAQGLGAAVMMALALAFVGATVPREMTGRAMGLLGTMSAIGTALGPALGGLLISMFGWRSIFLINPPIGIAALVLCRGHLPPEAPRVHMTRVPFDFMGTVLIAATLVAYSLAMTFGRGHAWLVNALLFAATAAGVVLFVCHQRRTSAPLIPLQAFRDRALGAGLIASAIVTTVMMATLVVGPFYLALALGLGDALVGMVMSIGPALSALSGVPAGRMVDRLGGARMVTISLGAMAVASIALVTLPPLLGVAGYVAAIAILTPAYQQFQAANNTIVMSEVPQDQRGVISGLLNLSRNLGLITGASAMGAVFATISKSKDLADTDPASVTRGMQVTFALAATLIVGALLISLVSPRSRAMPATQPATDRLAARRPFQF